MDRCTQPSEPDLAQYLHTHPIDGVGWEAAQHAVAVATPEGKTMMDRWLPLIPLNRMAEVSDLQGAVVYLASAASDYMTGHDLLIDGGYCTW